MTSQRAVLIQFIQNCHVDGCEIHQLVDSKHHDIPFTTPIFVPVFHIEIPFLASQLVISQPSAPNGHQTLRLICSGRTRSTAQWRYVRDVTCQVLQSNMVDCSVETPWNSRITYCLVVGPPLWKIWKSIGMMIIPNIWENKKCSKPPTSISYIYIHIILRYITEDEPQLNKRLSILDWHLDVTGSFGPANRHKTVWISRRMIFFDIFFDISSVLPATCSTKMKKTILFGISKVRSKHSYPFSKFFFTTHFRVPYTFYTFNRRVTFRSRWHSYRHDQLRSIRGFVFGGWIAATMWGPPVISWFINPMNYSYKYHKPELLKLCSPT